MQNLAIQNVRNSVIAIAVSIFVVLGLSLGFSSRALAINCEAGGFTGTEMSKCQACDGTGGSYYTTDGGCSDLGDATDEKVSTLAEDIINILSFIVGVAAVIMIIIGGFKYVTSNGDANSITGAKNTILYAIIGLVIVAMAQVIVQFVIGKI